MMSSPPTQARPVMHIEPQSGLKFYPCEERGCFYARGTQQEIQVAPMFENGLPDFDSVTELDSSAEVSVEEVERFLASVATR